MPESRTSPYPGLRPYTDADQEYFYGRSGDRLVIAANFLTAALTVVYGPSGAGKSSLLNAAVAPDLLKQRRTEVIIFRKWSGADFLRDLKSKCAEPGARSGRPIDIGQPLDEILIAAGAAINGQILVVLDQFEEYLQYNSETEADGFESQLAQAVNRDDVPANFLIAIREDWYFKLERFRRRIPSLFRHSIRLSYLDDKAARDAIRKPVEVYDRQSGGGEPTEIEEGAGGRGDPAGEESGHRREGCGIRPKGDEAGGGSDRTDAESGGRRGRCGSRW